MKQGRKPIQDEFTGLTVSRQRKWQLRKKKECRCVLCGDKLFTKNDCYEHARAKTIRSKTYYHLKGIHKLKKPITDYKPHLKLITRT